MDVEGATAYIMIVIVFANTYHDQNYVKEWMNIPRHAKRTIENDGTLNTGLLLNSRIH